MRLPGAMKKTVCLLLVLILLAVPAAPARAADVVSDVIGLDGLTGIVADKIFDAGCELIGGTTYNLAANLYNAAAGSINLLTGEYTVAGKVMGWTKVGINVASVGAIIFALATGSATLPVIATITVTAAVLEVAVEVFKEVRMLFSWLQKNISEGKCCSETN